MALTRKFLTALGIEQDKAEEIITAHTETVEALKKQRDEYKGDAEKLPGIQKELDELRQAAEKNANNPYKAQYEELKTEYEKYKADVTARETKTKKESAYKALLKEAGVSEKRIDSILKVTAIDQFELDNDGKIKEAEEQLKHIKEEWADFIPTQAPQGAQTPTPPTNNGGNVKAPSRAAQIAAKFQAEHYGEVKKEA